MPFTLVTREEWLANPPKKKGEPLPSPILKVIMVRTKTPPCEDDDECKEHVKSLQVFHMEKGMDDIPYSFIITPDCKVYEGRGWNTAVPTPPDRPELRNKALVIGHIGDFPDDSKEQAKILSTTFNFIEHGVEKLKYIRQDFDLRKWDDDLWINNTAFKP